MAEFRNQVLQGRQPLDGNQFHDCEFRNAELVFRGGEQPALVNCRFVQSRFVFEGEAASTVNLLRGMLQPQSNLRSFVLGMMPEIVTVAPIR
ncbi:MAG: hypothetical protein Q8S03_13710 [Brevundimonas sp.]|uniref:hypothetical protein n=1 Tax=Brevundimonas sp. TaxID=1871086 RepID=UPI0027344ED2|nr:hypothetical protein [Brevundimonas sp.]MDP3405748.1 hypothetical protein [Brevundimonas sp.]